jgi:hypothetical protein
MGGRRVKNYRKLGVPKCAKSRFLLYSSVYIFRSERSAPRPPKKWHFWPPHWSKSTAYLWGMVFSIGPFLGVDFGGRKWGSFCRKLQNFKKFIIMTPPDPPGQKWSILAIFDPPMACQILATFGSIYTPPFLIIFSLFFGQFITHRFLTFISNIFDQFLPSNFKYFNQFLPSSFNIFYTQLNLI